jgi:hypothetical protein
MIVFAPGSALRQTRRNSLSAAGGNASGKQLQRSVTKRAHTLSKKGAPFFQKARHEFEKSMA